MLKDQFTKAVASYRGNLFRYNSRQEFISDVCKAIQSQLKEWEMRSKLNGNPVKDILFHYTFEIYSLDKANEVRYLAEEWEIQLDIGEDIVVQKCVQRDFEHRSKTRYFSEELKSSKADVWYNKVRNISEFRAFLNGECLGVGGMADQPKEKLNKDSIMFNLLLTLLEDSLTEWDGIKDKDFRDHVCRETGMSKEYFNELVKEYWGD